MFAMGGDSHSALTVRPPDRWHNHKLFFAVVFIVAAAALFQWGNIRFRQRHGVAYRATAAIRLAEGAGTGDAIASGKTKPPVDYAACLAKVVQQLNQPETLHQVLTELADKGLGSARRAAALAEARENGPSATISGQELSSFQVSVRPLGDSLHQVFITCTSSDQALALPVVNALAARGADLFRQSCRSKLQAAVASAAEELERSGGALAEVRRNIDHVLAVLSDSAEQYGGFSGRRAPDRGQSGLSAPNGKSPEVGAPEPQYHELVENPRWTELQLKLHQLEHQRAALLVDRTEAHPAVRQVEAAIAEARRQLAETSQWGEGPPSRQPASATKAVNAEPKMAGSPEPVISGQEEATLHGLKQSLADAQRRTAQAALKYEQAMAAARAIPEVEVRWATGCLSIAPVLPLARLLLAALGSGLAATIGVCLIGAGVSAENAVATRAEVESRLPVPVVGVIPAESPGVDPRAFRVRQRLARWGKVLIGAMLVVGALAALLAS